MDTSRARSSADRCYDNRREACLTTRSSTTTCCWQRCQYLARVMSVEVCGGASETTLLSIGMRENFVYGALYSYSVNGIVMILMATHVDDVIWADETELETIVQEMHEFCNSVL